MDVCMKLALILVFATPLGQTGFLEEKLEETGEMSPRRNYLFGTDFDDTIYGSHGQEKRGRCNFGRSCKECPEGAYRVMAESDVACCADCSKYFRSGYIYGSPECVCDRLEYVIGDCWMGSKCDVCNNSVVGRINTIPICCPNCEMSGLHFSPTHCNCLHNGPGMSLWKQGYTVEVTTQHLSREGTNTAMRPDEDSRIKGATAARRPAEDSRLKGANAATYPSSAEAYFVIIPVIVIKLNF